MRSATDYKQIVLVNFDLSKINHSFFIKKRRLSLNYQQDIGFLAISLVKKADERECMLFCRLIVFLCWLCHTKTTILKTTK